MPRATEQEVAADLRRLQRRMIENQDNRQLLGAANLCRVCKVEQVTGRLCAECERLNRTYRWFVALGEASYEQRDGVLDYLLRVEGAGLASIQLAMLGTILAGTIGGMFFYFWDDGRSWMFEPNGKNILSPGYWATSV